MDIRLSSGHVATIPSEVFANVNKMKLLGAGSFFVCFLFVDTQAWEAYTEIDPSVLLGISAPPPAPDNFW